MDPNSTNPPSDDQQQPQQDAGQPDMTQTNSVPPPPPVSEPDATPATASTTDQGQADTQGQPTQDNPEQAAADYIENVGESLIDLMDEVNSDDNLIKIVADEMKLDEVKVKSILTTLLDKIDKEQITVEELAFIMAVTVVDEPPQETK